MRCIPKQLHGNFGTGFLSFPAPARRQRASRQQLERARQGVRPEPGLIPGLIGFILLLLLGGWWVDEVFDNFPRGVGGLGDELDERHARLAFRLRSARA